MRKLKSDFFSQKEKCIIFNTILSYQKEPQNNEENGDKNARPDGNFYES